MYGSSAMSPSRFGPSHSISFGEVETLALLFVAAQADDVGVVGVDHQLAVLKGGQAREVVFAGIAVRRHAHDLELTVEHLETEELGDCAVQAAESPDRRIP